MKKVKVLVAQSCPTFCDPTPTKLLSSWNSPGKNTGVGCRFLLQGIFLIQGIKPGSPALQADSLPSEPLGKPHTYIYTYIHTYIYNKYIFIICIFYIIMQSM